MNKQYDFSGWATKNDLKCSDGRTIKKDAFKDNDGQIVPLVWNHQHDDSDNILGHALLENRPEGVYAYCFCNDTEKGQNAKLLVQHGDITGLSIYANKLKQIGGDVLHGAIREVSLVLAGANPGAFIDSVITHGYESDEEGVIYTGENLFLEHFDNSTTNDEEINNQNEETLNHSNEEKKEKNEMPEEKTVNDVIETMNDEQKKVLYSMVASALETAAEVNDEEEEESEKDMKHNIFENEDNSEETLQHAEINDAINDAKRYGSLKESFLQHGITNIEYLFPEDKIVSGTTPGFINTNPLGWVNVIMNGVHHTPFSRIKMQFADITVDTARAKGYIKGKQKVEEQFGLLKRSVGPTTVYKKQKLDRDDVVDIADFDVVAWLKREMRMKLDEELARAFIFGDGRSPVSDDKINETCIIPIVSDTTNDLYAMKKVVAPATGESFGHALINAVVKGMDAYEGSGNTILFISRSHLSDMLLLEDDIGHRLYKGIDDLALAMTVKKIVDVPASIIPEGVYGVVVDLNDYNVGADKGGAVNMFDDFDIDYNAQKYLIETRCSGALTLPHSAIVLVEPEETTESH